MKTKHTPLFTVVIWRIEAEAGVQAEAQVEAWIRAPAAIDVELDWGRCLPNVSRPQVRCQDGYKWAGTWHRAAASASQPWCEPCSSTAWSLWLDWRVWSILTSFCHYSYDIQTHHRCSFIMFQSSNLVSLKLISKDHLHHIMKCSVVIVVTLGCSLVVGVMMLVQEVIGDDVEVEQNLFNISNSSMFCMLLISQQCLLSKQ